MKKKIWIVTAVILAAVLILPAAALCLIKPNGWHTVRGIGAALLQPGSIDGSCVYIALRRDDPENGGNLTREDFSTRIKDARLLMEVNAENETELYNTGAFRRIDFCRIYALELEKPSVRSVLAVLLECAFQPGISWAQPSYEQTIDLRSGTQRNFDPYEMDPTCKEPPYGEAV